MRPSRVPFPLLLGLAATSGQPYGTDIICSTTGQVLYRINPAGVVTTIASGMGSTTNMVAMDNDNTNYVVINTSPPSMRVVDRNSGAILRTITTGGPLSGADYFNPLHTGDFVLAATNNVTAQRTLFKVNRDGSGLSTIAVGPPFANLQGLVQDVVTGGISVGDITALCIFDVALDGTVRNTWASGLVGPFAMTQDPLTGDLILGQGASSARGVYRFHHANASLTTIAPQSVVGNSNAICFDRDVGFGEIAVGTSPVRRIDAGGTVLATYSGVPTTNSGMCFDRERNVVSIQTGTPNQFRFDLNFPGEGGRSYALALSVTGMAPGIPVDARAIHLNLDPILLLSISGGLFPLLQNNIGVLDANDRASATLDLSAFGAGPLTGLRVWADAIVLQPGSPSGISTIAKAIVLVLD